MGRYKAHLPDRSPTRRLQTAPTGRWERLPTPAPAQTPVSRQLAVSKTDVSTKDSDRDLSHDECDGRGASLQGPAWLGYSVFLSTSAIDSFGRRGAHVTRTGDRVPLGVTR